MEKVRLEKSHEKLGSSWLLRSRVALPLQWWSGCLSSVGNERRGRGLEAGIIEDIFTKFGDF